MLRPHVLRGHWELPLGVCGGSDAWRLRRDRLGCNGERRMGLGRRDAARGANSRDGRQASVPAPTGHRVQSSGTAAGTVTVDTAEEDITKVLLTSPDAAGASEQLQTRAYWREVVLLATPALGMCLTDPMMSVLDTAFVGRVSSVQLAALSPSASVFTTIYVLTSFIGVCTTYLVASQSVNPAMPQDVQALRRERARRAVAHGMLVAAVLGTALMAALLVGAEPLLDLFGARGDLVPYGALYTRIRALATPAMVLTSVCQAASLGEQDTLTPLKVALGVGAINTFGDWLLVPQWGIGGAALATAASQWIGAATYLAVPSTRSGEPGRLRLTWAGIPTQEDLAPFLSMAGAIITRNAFIMAAYSIMTSTAAGLGVVATAAHQVSLPVIWLVSCAVEPVSIAAQTLVARDMHLPAQVSRLARLLLRVGFLAGGLLAGVLAGVYMFPSLFTSDAAVQSAMQSLLLPSVVALPVCGAMMVYDGLCVGSSDMSHVARLNFFALVGTTLYFKAAAAAMAPLPVVWWGLVLFFCLRAGQNALHFYSTRHTNVFSPTRVPA